MKTIRKIMALALVLCMAAAMGVWNTDAHADWYTVQFNKLDNRTFENIPTGVTLTTTAAASASSADTPAASTAGTAADPQKPGQLEWFYNPWAGTLVIRGRGAMVGFDEKHPAPWHNESKRALRVIIDEGVTTISNEAFKDFIYLRSVVFPSTLKGISATAFEKCEKLKRVEVVTEIKDAEKLIEASKSEELLMDDVKIIRVTKEAVRREICWLTTYWWDRVEIYRDKAGRPIRIIEHKCDGSTVDTGIKYLNEATAVNEAKDPDTVERSYSVTTTRRGEKSAKEKEVNEYGVALVSGQYDLNKNGRQVSGTELTRNYEWTENPTPEKYYEVEKRTLDNAAYYSDGSGTKNWTRVNSYGETEKIIEQVDKNDRILSVSSVTYDDHGIACRKSETKNSYNDDGNKTATQVVQTDANGNVETKTDTKYDYNGAKQLTAKTEEIKNANGEVMSRTESSYAYDKDGNLVTATNTSDFGKTEVTNYTYTDKGKKTGSTTTEIYPGGGVTTTAKKYDDNERVSQETVVYKAQDGTVYSAESTEYSYNSDHVVSESIKTTTNPDGSEATSVCSYDANGQMTTETRVDVNSEGKTQTVITSYTYDSEGRRISEKQESIDPEGKTSTYSWTKKYDGQGREIGFDSVSVESDGSTYTSQRQNIYDALGRVVYQFYEDTDAAGKKIGNIRTYTYHEDGTYDETDTPIGEPVVLAAKLADSSEETAGDSTNATAPEGGSVLADTSLNAQPSEEKQIAAGGEVTEPETENKEQEAKKEKETVSSEVVDPDAEGKTQEGKAEDIQNTEDGVVNMLSATAAGKNLEEDNTVADTAKKTEEEGEQDSGDDTLKSLPTGENEDQEENEESQENQSEDGEDTGGIAMPMLRTLMMPPPATMPVASEDVHVLEGDLNVKTPPTCGTEGRGTQHCSVCEQDIEVTIPATGAHTLEGDVTELEPATCGTEGRGTRHCSVCEQDIEVTIPATGAHTLEGDVTELEPATCGAEGRGTRHCSVCDRDIEVTIPATGAHTLEGDVTELEPATCGAEGRGTRHCSVCDRDIEVTIPATGEHNYQSAETQAPTCTAEGIRTFTCVCGASYTESIPKTEHHHVRTQTTATCTAGGTETWTCVCGDSFTKNVDAYGHNFGEELIVDNPGTCSTPGTGHRVCSTCQASSSPEAITVSHSFGDPYANENGDMVHKCSACLTVEPVPAA